MLLHEFLSANHDDLEQRCRVKVAKRNGPKPVPPEQEHGIPVFIDQLIETLRLEETAQREHAELTDIPKNIGSRAGEHGGELLRRGYTVEQVVHDYGDLCQALTELAHEKKEEITVAEFHTFNRCLDNAIADAVTEFGRQRDQLVADADNQTMNERLGCLAHELRNLLNTAMLAFSAIQSGDVAMSGATGGLLSRSLVGLRELIDRSLADVRLSVGPRPHRESISILELVNETRISAGMEAKARELTLSIPPVDEAWVVEGDRQMLAAAIANLLQNAFKFTLPEGHVTLRVNADTKRVRIDIEDQCGGLPGNKAEEMFQPFHQRSGDRTGLGLGLSISRRGVEANGGTLQVRNLPGTGCIFTIDLPRQQQAQAVASAQGAAILPPRPSGNGRA